MAGSSSGVRRRPRGRLRVVWLMALVALVVGVAMLAHPEWALSLRVRELLEGLASPAVVEDHAEDEVATKQDTAKAVEPLFDAEGRTGWLDTEDGSRVYYDPDTSDLHHGWLDLGEERYYCDDDTGSMHIGWIELDGRSYWLDDGGISEPGVLLKDRWLEVGGKTYHLGPDGAADEGWCEIDGSTYCFDSAGAMRTGWASGEDGNRRWLKPEDGTMAAHEWVEIDGLWQPFDDDGSWVTSGELLPPDDATNLEAMSARQRAVVDSCDQTPWPGKALCAAWVSQVFVNAGEPSVDGDACDLARNWCTTDDLAQLKPGMIIAVTSHSRTENGRIWGHVCIYEGGGIVRDSGTYGVRRSQLGSWLAWFGTDESPRCGLANGIPLGYD